jgi:hypothetical protein
MCAARINGVLCSNRAAGTVFLYNCEAMGRPAVHERASHSFVGQKLARLHGFAFGGEYVSGSPVQGRPYFVPMRTLDSEQARALGIRGEHDLFGGVVPSLAIATKSIVHPLLDSAAACPPDWPRDFAARAQPLALAGYSAFSLDDLKRAAALLLARGRVRQKPAGDSGGRGQILVSQKDALDEALRALDTQDLATAGVVVEEELKDPLTYSVGQVRVADLIASYYGTQATTSNNDGDDVYGGSSLFMVRGDFASLAKTDLPDATREAVFCARAFDELVQANIPGFFASRRNYDIIEGVDVTGERRCCLLEQSWRIGGASGAEVAGLEVFRAEPDTAAVEVGCVEVYGERAEPPPGADLGFCGIDPELGPMLKYAVVGRRHGNA